MRTKDADSKSEVEEDDLLIKEQLKEKKYKQNLTKY